MYSSLHKSLLLRWNVLFLLDNKNIKWRKICFAPASERNIWQRAGVRERDSEGESARKTECVRGDLSVLGFMDFFFQSVNFACWDGSSLCSVSGVEFQSATYHMVTKYNWS